MDNENRRIRKCFKCNNCKKIETQLVHPNQFRTKCSKCASYLNEIPEKEYKILKKRTKENNENSRYENHNEPIRPPQDAFRNISSVYDRPPSHAQNKRENNNNNINRSNRFENNNNNQQQRNRRYVSNNHYSDMNMNNINNNINNNHMHNNFMQNSNNNIRENNNNNNSRQNNNSNNRNPREYGQGARERNRSSLPMTNSLIDNIFSNFFNPIPIVISNGGPFRIIIQSQNVPRSIFDPLFLAFGAAFNDNFRNNFSSNFRSNFRGNFLTEIIRILERNLEEAARNAHPPASEKALEKLKKFPMSDKYCKKNKNGNIELPNCCICLSEIVKNEETVLLPCGHMFHWNCCLNWLKTNNTCPMCRFEIKE